MYGNSPLGDDGLDPETLSPDQRRQLERDLSRVAQQTRRLLPEEFVVGSDLTAGSDGPEATVAVRPPVGPVVSAGYTPEEADATITEDEQTDLAQGLAASAALQVKQALSGSTSPTAR
ncbi:hypothetical protein HZS55_05055 [Halosimplex rubrum]|uniref:Uncharacterized protein n=1 Tax=Halosimplex rubrum TaxID=869889 RepID=A0A7D5SWP6_9EURY|nr:DUF5811 family protein [Halosimplex rubrum]QLH76711.1 hypothetical protein HZS55_05055 [Halosimplex rubrum]